MWRHLPSALGGRPPLPAESLPAAPDDGDVRAASELVPSGLPAQVPMPDLVGLASTEARRLARQSHLLLEVLERGTGEALWGQVLAQDPPPGTSVAAAAEVAITIGVRPHVIVPDVRGREEDEAIAMLREAGLGAPRRTARRSDRVPEGCVVRTRPRAGAEVPGGSRVSYVVASGARDTAGGRKRDRGRTRVSRLPDGSFVSLLEGEDPPRR